ncbi:MAG: hypothetical protein GX958_12200 [Desulfitobacterium sp.]|nr:hypothetical protein [Desulfitobacterium sp.]
MMSTGEDALRFIREFEITCREVLVAKGTSEHELGNAALELQWKFLRMLREKKGTLNHAKSASQGSTSSIA